MSKHLIEAKVAIQIVTERIAPENMAARVALSDTKISTARKLLTNAKITLLAARMLHDNAQTPSGHARAIAKAYAAKGFVLTSDQLLASR